MSITTEIIAEAVGFEPADKNKARDILIELTGNNETDLVTFGTKAGVFTELGVSAVVCGPSLIEQGHKADEYVSLVQVQQCLNMLERLGDKLGR